MTVMASRSWLMTYWLPLTLSVLAVAFALGEDTLRLELRYDRAVIADGGWGRLISGHLVHASWSHAALNLAGLWVVWLLFAERLGTRFGLWVTLVAVVVMDLGFWFRDTELGWYVGLSGLLHGLFAAGALDETVRRVRGGLWLLLGLAFKLGYEQWFGALPMTEEASGAPVWVNAHLYGALGGLAAVALWAAFTCLRRSRA